MRIQSSCCSLFVLLLTACEPAEQVPREDAGSAGPHDASQHDARRENEAGQDGPRDSASEPSEARDALADPDDARASDAASDAAVVCASPEEEKFSFFLISYKAVQRESGSADGFGGDLGGIRGADAICQRVAEASAACQKGKPWRAFLSTTKEHAIERIGNGPWHDRLGRPLAQTLADLQQERPRGASPLIIDDLPNEEGVPNHNPDGTGNVDNHQTLSGSGTDGKLYTQGDAGSRGGSACGPSGEAWTPEKATCWDWTSAKPEGCPRIGHSWPRQGSGLHWISTGNEGGCAPGVVLADRGGLDGTRRIGSGGGYGGFYCFRITSP